MRLAWIDAKMIREIDELRASGVQLAREKKCVVCDERIAGNVRRHSADDRKVEPMAVVCDQDVVTAEFTERRPYLFEVRLVGDFFCRDAMSAESTGGDENARFEERLVFIDNRPAANLNRSDLDDLGFRCIVV